MKKNSPAKVLFASLAGTTIEFFDFYIYANAAVLVFPSLFFAASTQSTEMLQSLATFAVAFFARPLGSAFFGHFGDRIGRKTTLVAALLTMGVSTVAIGLLPTYQSIGIFAPILLVICRFGQGFGLILSGGIFLYLSSTMTEAEFFDYGWRIPFLLSSVLILIGLYVRLTILETPEFIENQKNKKTIAIPFVEVFKNYRTPMILGTFIALATFVLFYLMTVYIASWAITDLNINREDFLGNQIESVLLFAVFIPISAVLADRYGRKLILIVASLGIILFGLVLGPLLNTSLLLTLSIGMALMGFTYGPLGTMLSELYPTNVRYTGSSLSFNFAGIVGASFAPFIALWLSSNFGVHYVGYYLALAAIISLIATYLSSKAK